MPDGTEEVKVAMYDQEGGLVLAKKITVQPGFKFTVEATK